MKNLNIKNKIFIFVFSLIILIIIAILIYSIRFVGNKNSTLYNVTNNTVLFASDSNQIKTNNGGKIEKRWNNSYYYLSSDNKSYLLGKSSVIYDKSSEVVTVLGEKYQVLNDGSVLNNKNTSTISDLSTSYFYKLDDRVYLIVSKEIYNTDKSIYASKYLIVYIDKQGNASVLNDALNVKTINPMNLTFGNYVFDIANEKLIINDLTIDLKLIIGSTNEYVFKEKKEDEIKYDSKKLIDSYNQLVNNFNQYANNHNLSVSGNNQVSYNNVVINANGSNTNNSNNVAVANNKTNITKRVSLRGSVSYSSYIDVSYIVTDPEDKYQAVYLLVTGYFDRELKTEKIILDKYDTRYRILNLVPNNEYTISLGYIEIVFDNLGEKRLEDNIEDIINVRTTKVDYKFNIEKISSGYVYFNFKMTKEYAIDSGNIFIYTDGIKNDEGVSINYQSMISDKGYSARLPLANGTVYELRVENGIYDNQNINFVMNKKFSIST